MADMVTTEDIRILMLKSEFTADETAACEMYIDMAIGEIEAWLGRPVTVQAFTESHFPDALGTIYLNKTPVVSVTSVTVNDTLEADDFFTVTSYGLENIFEQSYDYATISANEIDTNAIYGATVVVEYTGGLDFPMAVRSLVLRSVIAAMHRGKAEAARDEAGAVGARKIQVQDYTIEYERAASSSRSGGNSALSMFQSDSDFATIKRYKKTQVA